MAKKTTAKKATESTGSIGRLAAELRGFQQTGPGTARGVAKAGAAVDQKYMKCLKTALQAAITLEFGTIPPYLTALWSIKDERHPVAMSIREVAHEEMLHMALVCNILASIGGKPGVNRDLPTYPGSLPGGVHRGLVVKLSGLTKDVLKDFLWIERPVQEVPHEHPFQQPGEEWSHEIDLKQDATIGEFYDAIKDTFIQKKPPMTPDNQITGPLALGVVRNEQDVARFIELIKHQGEGSTDKPTYDRTKLIKPGRGSTGKSSINKEKASHFYRFLEVYEEFTLKWDEKQKKLIRVSSLPFPDVWPVAVVPKGGYLQKDVSPDVWYQLDQFDASYSRMMDLLQGAWTRGGQAAFVHAIEEMFNLEKHARILMQAEIPGGQGKTYGPCFRYKPR